MIRNGMSRRLAFLQRQAQQEQEITLLRAQWAQYALPVQAALETHLTLYGYNSALDTTALVDRLLADCREREMRKEQ